MTRRDCCDAACALLGWTSWVAVLASLYLNTMAWIGLWLACLVPVLAWDGILRRQERTRV